MPITYAYVYNLQQVGKYILKIESIYKELCGTFDST